MHGLSHRSNQFLDFPAANLGDAQRARRLPQNGISCLNDFKFRAFHNFRSGGAAVRAPAILIQPERIYGMRAIANWKS
jgi:hypothetical protein